MSIDAELRDYLTGRYGPDVLESTSSLRIADLERQLNAKTARIDFIEGVVTRAVDGMRDMNAALIRRCAEQAHEIARLTLALAEKNAPAPTPSPAALAAIEAMQRSGIR